MACFPGVCVRVALTKERDQAKADVVGLSEVIEQVEALLPRNFLMSDDAAKNVSVFVEAQREAISRLMADNERLRRLMRAAETNGAAQHGYIACPWCDGESMGGKAVIHSGCCPAFTSDRVVR